MAQYLVAIQHPENYDPSLEGEAMIRDIGALNEEMDAAGARFFAGGLETAAKAKSLRKQPGGEVVITDGPYLETKEHVGGFWILEAADMDEALAWGRKAVVACRVPVEVRAFLKIRPNRKSLGHRDSQ
ncbi:MAG TPA: YciI family protein [Terriglobales bacterium]|nr:YciI family protein [Terriglobales bacterium]